MGNTGIKSVYSIRFLQKCIAGLFKIFSKSNKGLNNKGVRIFFWF